jgi:response regulator RpfG family c-di-GMP phosphodiesterase
MSQAVNLRVLYLGDRLNDVVALYGELDESRNCVVEAQCGESNAVLAFQEPFDFVIIDHCLQDLGGALFLERLHAHSPQAERLIIARASDRGAMELATAREAPVLRTLHAPRSSVRVYGAVPSVSRGTSARYYDDLATP